jgi:hypothetical protein
MFYRGDPSFLAESTTIAPSQFPEGNDVTHQHGLEGFLATACIFGAAFLLPLLFQFLHGASALDSGTLIVPFLGGVIVGAFRSGDIAAVQRRAVYRFFTSMLGANLASRSADSLIWAFPRSIHRRPSPALPLFACRRGKSVV